MLFILRKLPFLLLVFLRVDATQNLHNSKHEKRLVRLKPNQSISQQNFEKDGPRNLKKSKRRSYGKQSSKNSKKAGSKASKASSSRPKQRSPGTSSCFGISAFDSAYIAKFNLISSLSFD